MAVGVVYDPRMCAHRDPRDKFHPEKPARTTAIWQCLEDAGVLDRCVRVNARPATVEELLTVHTERHIEIMSSVSGKTYGKEGRAALARRYNSIYFNTGSSESALLAAGSVIELSLRVARGELASAAAIVRPPGHHAEADEAMGFCLFNNVAVAAQILSLGTVAGKHKVLIVDWDIHHGNGTQNMFWQDPNVLYFSVHRYDDGLFYPGGREGNYDKVGGGPGAGYNINVPWPRGGYGDADYLAVWEHVLMPVAKEFNPDIVLISGGFDSARGDPLGGCNVTPLGYSIMTQDLMQLAGGKLVLALEGGYNLESIAESYLACVQVLLGDVENEQRNIGGVYESTWTIIDKVRQGFSRYWPVLSGEIEKSAAKPCPVKDHVSEESDEELDSGVGVEELVVDLEEEEVVIPEIIDTTGQVELVKALETLTMEPEAIKDETQPEGLVVTSETVEITQVTIASELLNPESSSVYVWYASYGSNMWPPRLLCYIQGGKVDGAEVPARGLRDKTPPLEDFWLAVSHRLFFGRESSFTWGSGGVAFMDPVPSNDDVCHARAYKITLEQFNGILAQENKSVTHDGLVSASHFDTLRKPPHVLDVIENAWYGTVLYLGDKDGLPILTITCSKRDATLYMSGELPVRAPSLAYRKTLVNGLRDNGSLSDGEVLAYISKLY